MQPSDTAYPRFKTRLTPTELEQFYTPTDEELAFCADVTRLPTTQLGFVVLLKTFQRLGYFVPSNEVPQTIIEHIAVVINRRFDREELHNYDQSKVRYNHLMVVRRFLDVKPFSAEGKTLLRTTLSEAALTKEDVADIINVGIEILVRHRYELPAFDTLVREARAGRAATNQALYEQVHSALGKTGATFLDTLFVVGDDPRRVSPWHDLKQDPAKPTVHGMRDTVGALRPIDRAFRPQRMSKNNPNRQNQPVGVGGQCAGCRQHGRSSAIKTVCGHLGGDSSASRHCDR